MTSNFLKYIPGHKVLLCLVCEKSYCLPPGSVAKHLCDFHCHILTKKQGSELVKFSNSVELSKPANIIIPQRGDGRVEGLHKENGYECNECEYVCGSEEVMKKHC
jgi:Protein of unknown function (DUF3505).